jgi:hypothetical protein
MFRHRSINSPHVIVPVLLVLLLIASCRHSTVAQVTASTRLVELVPIDVDPKHTERRDFSSLKLLSAFQLTSKSKRFGGLSGLSIGSDGKLYAVSDRGHWLSADMVLDPNGALKDLVGWRIAPILSTSKRPVSGKLRDAEALAQAHDGSFLVAFEGLHRIWRYDPPPKTFESIPVPMPIPTSASLAPSNGGIEALTVLPDGRLLIIAEVLENPDGSVKAWMIDDGRFTELSYLAAKGFRVTDCTALKNGDLLVLERRYAPLGILSARVTLVKADSLRPGIVIAGKELLKLEQPLAVDNFEGIAVQETVKGTMIYIVSDDNYSRFQQTLLLQFALPNADR